MNVSFKSFSGSGSEQKESIGSIFRNPNKGDAENQRSEKWASKVLDNILYVSLAAIFFGIPVFFTGFASQGIGFEKQMYFYFWILIALIAWTSNGVIKGEMSIRRTPLDIPILIFWFVYLISTVFSIDKWHSFWGFFGDPTHGFINVTASIIVYYIILSHFNERFLRIMLGAFLSSGFVVMIWEILMVRGIIRLQDPNFVQSHGWAQFFQNSPIGSISGTAIFLSAMLVLLVTVFLKTKLSEMPKTKKIALLTIFSVMMIMALYLLLAFYFFVPWPGILIGIGFFLIYVLARIVKTDEGSIWLPMVIFMAILAILLMGNNLATNRSIFPATFPAEVNPQHKLSWQVAKAAMKDNFFLGSGPATYGYIFSEYRPQEFNLNNLYNLRFYQGSGVLWEALPTLGALGTFALILLLASFLSVGIYLLSKDKEKNKIYSLGTMAAMLVILVSAFITRLDGSLIIVGVLLATITLGINLKESDAKENHLNLSLKASPKYALALAFVFLVVSAGVVFLFVFLGKIYAADIFAGISGRQRNITIEGSVAPIIKAVNLYNKESRYYTIGGQQYIALANSEFLKGDKADTNLIREYLDNSIVLASKGKELMPKDALAGAVLAQAIENKASYLNEFLDQAITSYNDTLALEPHNPDVYLKIGQLKAKQASIEKDEAKKKDFIDQAIEMFQKSVDKKANYALGYYYLSLINGQLGKTDEAISFAEKALTYNNQGADYILNLANLYRSKGGDDNLKNAELLYQRILQFAPNDTNTLLGLGLLYEKTSKKDDAIKQYKKVLDSLPTDAKQAREQIQKLISNVENGISNEAAASAAANQKPAVEEQNPVVNTQQ